MVIREDYLKKMIDAKDTDFIKVVTGVRRSGKSELLHMFIDYVQDNDNNSNIIYIDYNLDEFDSLKQYKELGGTSVMLTGGELFIKNDILKM